MCTVTYLPIYKDGFILTSSRDEKAIRPLALAPQPSIIGEHQVYFPQDPQGKGTWIAASATTTLCLLNGAYTAHIPQPLYKHSRGLILLHFFEYASIDDFIRRYDFAGLEPFTLIMVAEVRLVELRWNGRNLTVYEKDHRNAYIWSSATLYTPEVVAKRIRWFREWLQTRRTSSVEDIRRFHQTAGDGDEANDILMNRDDHVYTVSLTSVVSDAHRTEMFYEDLITETFVSQVIALPYETAHLVCH